MTERNERIIGECTKCHLPIEIHNDLWEEEIIETKVEYEKDTKKVIKTVTKSDRYHEDCSKALYAEPYGNKNNI